MHGEELLNVFYIVFNSAEIYKHRFLSYLGHDFIHVHVQLIKELSTEPWYVRLTN